MSLLIKNIQIITDMNATNVQIFNNKQFGSVRTLEINNNPYFVGNDIAECLGYAYPKNAIRDNVDEEDKQTVQLSDIQEGEYTPPSHMRGSKIVVINESGVYSLIFGSKLPTAKEFKRWVTSEVLPSVRKTGGYMIVKDSDTPEEIMSRALLIAQDTLKRKEERVAMLEEQNRLNEEQIKLAVPKVQYYDNVLQSKKTYTSTQIAKELGFRSATQMHKKLKDKGIMFLQSGQWLVTAKYSDKGYTKTRTHTYTDSYTGLQGTNTITVWTEKGREFLYDKLSSTINA